MRRAAAVITDATLAGILGFIGFRLGVFSAPCGDDLGDCFAQIPLIVGLVVLGLVGYFSLGHVLWKSTPGQRLFRLEEPPPYGDTQ
jgi:hypothetical protein